MTTSNHILAGTLIAVTVKEPALVIPLAFLSHFLLDAIPHYGYDGSGYEEAMKHKLTYLVEALGLIGIVLLLMTGLYGWNLALLASIIAVSPDIEWPYRYLFFERKHLEPPRTLLTDIHKKVQWCERAWGIIPEVLFFTGGYLLLLHLTT